MKVVTMTELRLLAADCSGRGRVGEIAIATRAVIRISKADWGGGASSEPTTGNWRRRARTRDERAESRRCTLVVAVELR